MAELRVLETPRSRDVASVVERLEEALERAKAGEFVAIALCFVHREGGCNISWSNTENAEMLLAANLLLQTQLIGKINERR